jgi:TPR repeat protein
MRQKLLEIARRLIARDGEDAVTLSVVANEADIAHATIYGYFSSKREMLSALASLPPARGTAEPAAASTAMALEPTDLPAQATDSTEEPHVVVDAPTAVEASTSAPTAGASDDVEDSVPWDDDEASEEAPAPHHDRAIATGPEPDVAASSGSGISAFETGVPPEQHVEAQAAPEAALGEPRPALLENPSDAAQEAAAEDHGHAEGEAGTLAEFPDALHVGASQQQPGNAFDPVLPNYEQRRAQAAQLDTIARHLVLPEGGSKDGTDALIGRLETRLRVIEGAITGLEAKHNALETRCDVQVRPVSEQIEQLSERSQAFEARHLKTLSELRLEIHDLASRLSSADMSRNDAVAEELAWSPPADEPEPAADESTPETDTVAEPDKASEDEPRHAYLSAVRSLAKEGARQAAERESVEEAEKEVRRRKVYVAAGVAVACLGVIGLLFKFHPGSHGVSLAQSKISVPVAASAARPPLHSASNGSLAPLDALTARANKGDARAELVIGLKYLSGDGVPANDAQAARWLARAANKGNAVAQNHLGALYQSGRGVTRDIAQAKRCYEAAAAQGDRHAMSNLAVLYAGGSSTDRDFAVAASWFQRSASLGFVDAQFNLAVLFERGDGVPQSLLDAYRWYSIAARSGDAVAKTRAAAIATQISPEELQAAQRAVALFRPQPLNHAANDVPTMRDVLAQR